jgi:hypothetical protein
MDVSDGDDKTNLDSATGIVGIPSEFIYAKKSEFNETNKITNRGIQNVCLFSLLASH